MAEAHLSPDAHRRLTEEHAHRTGDLRREISMRIERAREHGDIRENADYDAAKNEQGLNEARVRQIEQILSSAVIVEHAPTDVVAAGVLVEIKLPGDEEPTVYLVGSIEERNDKYDVLSTNSPIGMAILGKGPGDTVTYQGPKREMSVTVVGVRLPD